MYTPEPKLKKLKKEIALTIFSEDRMLDYCEVTYEQMLKFLKQYGNMYRTIIKKVINLNENGKMK